MAQRLPTLKREAQSHAGGVVIVWHTSMDRLSGSWAVCHHDHRQGTPCRKTLPLPLRPLLAGDLPQMVQIAVRA
jgi:hypothetical protein